MADLISNLPLILQSQSSKEVTANGLFDAGSPSTIFGRNFETCSGLTWGYLGGKFSIAGTPTAIANGTLLLSASATNYVRVATATGVVDKVTSAPSGWPGPVASYLALYELVTDTTSVVQSGSKDWRTGGLGSVASGGTVPTGTGFTHITGGVQDGAATAVDLSSAHVTGTLAAARFLALTGDVTNSAGAAATTIANNAVTAAKIIADAVTTVKILDANVTNAKLANMANATIKGRTTAGTGVPEDLTAAQVVAIIASLIKPTESMVIACTDEATAITAGTGKITWRMPYAFTITDIRATLTVAQTSGSIFTVNVKESGTTIFSTKLTVDNTEKTTTTAATPRVLSDTSLADDAEMTVDVDQIGDGTAKGLKIVIIGTRT